MYKSIYTFFIALFFAVASSGCALFNVGAVDTYNKKLATAQIQYQELLKEATTAREAGRVGDDDYEELTKLFDRIEFGLDTAKDHRNTDEGLDGLQMAIEGLDVIQNILQSKEVSNE